MKKLLLSIVFILLFSALVPEAKAEKISSRNAKELIQLLLNSKHNTKGTKLTKKKLKKIVRKTARVYRKAEKDSDRRKKSRKIQRTARRLINIF